MLVVSFQKERERKRERERERRTVLINPPPNTRVNLLLFPLLLDRSILFIFSAEYRETDSNYQRSKKKKKKKKGKKGKKRDEKRERWKAFGKFFHDFDRFFFNRFSIIVES